MPIPSNGCSTLSRRSRIAANFTEIGQSLAGNGDGDAYIIAAGSSAVGVDTASNGNPAWGWAPVDNGNDDDNTGFAFVDTILSGLNGPAFNSTIKAMVNTVASTIAHEAGHTFGLEHAIGDIIDSSRQGATENVDFFSRIDLSLLKKVVGRTLLRFSRTPM